MPPSIILQCTQTSQCCIRSVSYARRCSHSGAVVGWSLMSSSLSSSSSVSNSVAFSLQAAAENPFPTLLEIMRHRSFSYSCIAVRNLCNCLIGQSAPGRGCVDSRTHNGLPSLSRLSTVITYHFVRPCSGLRFEFGTISYLQCS